MVIHAAGIGKGTANSRTVSRSRDQPASHARGVGDEAGIRASLRHFVANLPKAAHVASVAPAVHRFTTQMDFQREAATHFALEGIGRGEKVLMIGSRWEYQEILRGIEDLRKDLVPLGNPPSWRNRDLALFDAYDVQSELLVDDMPDGMHFASFIGRACEPIHGTRGIRVWNNLGARFHESGHRGASTAIERLWHQARRNLRVTILCSYPLQRDGPRAILADMKEPLEAHSHLIRPGRDGVAVEHLPRLAGRDAMASEVWRPPLPGGLAVYDPGLSSRVLGFESDRGVILRWNT